MDESIFHFIVMMIISTVLFMGVILIVVGKNVFIIKRKPIIQITCIVVVLGMSIGKYGAFLSLPWYLYYSLPLFMTMLLPPYFLKFTKVQTLIYLLLSFISAPCIHFVFSFFLNWKEYMPFWNIPFWKEINGN